MVEKNTDIRHKIKPLRTECGLTQDDLAALVGVTRTAVSQWETGATGGIGLRNATRVASALGLTLSDMQSLSAEDLIRKVHATKPPSKPKEKRSALWGKSLSPIKTGPEIDTALIPPIDPAKWPGADCDALAPSFGLPFPRRWLEDRGLSEGYLSAARVPDRAMSPALEKGDYIIVNEADTIPSRYGKLFLVVVDGAFTVRRVLVSESGKMELKLVVESPNAAEKRSMTPADSLVDFAIIGALVWRVETL